MLILERRVKTPYSINIIFGALAEINTSLKQEQKSMNLLVTLLITSKDLVGFSNQKNVFLSMLKVEKRKVMTIQPSKLVQFLPYP